MGHVRPVFHEQCARIFLRHCVLRDQMDFRSLPLEGAALMVHLRRPGDRGAEEPRTLEVPRALIAPHGPRVPSLNAWWRLASCVAILINPSRINEHGYAVTRRFTAFQPCRCISTSRHDLVDWGGIFFRSGMNCLPKYQGLFNASICSFAAIHSLFSSSRDDHQGSESRKRWPIQTAMDMGKAWLRVS